MKTLLHRRPFPVLIASIVLSAGPSIAQPAPEPAPAPPTEAPVRLPLAESLVGPAKQEYDAGRDLYEASDFAGAVLKFRRAYELSSDPRLLWNMAAAEKNQRHYTRVETLVDQYMRESGGTLSAAEAEDARALLETVRAFIGTVRVSSNEAGAGVLVDGVEQGKTPLPSPLRLDMGERRIQVVKDGFRAWTATITVVGRESADVAANLAKDVHEGRLRISAEAAATVRVDGRIVGDGPWQGTLPSGPHTVEVTAPGKRAHRTDVVVQDGELSTLQITLDPESRPVVAREESSLTWLWIAGGVALGAGLGVGSYFLFKPEDKGPPPPVDGSIGTVELPLRF